MPIRARVKTISSPVFRDSISGDRVGDQKLSRGGRFGDGGRAGRWLPLPDPAQSGATPGARHAPAEARRGARPYHRQGVCR